MPVGVCCSEPYFILLSQQVVQYLDHLCAGGAACGVELAVTAGNRASFAYQ